MLWCQIVIPLGLFLNCDIMICHSLNCLRLRIRKERYYALRVKVCVYPMGCTL